MCGVMAYADVHFRYKLHNDIVKYRSERIPTVFNSKHVWKIIFQSIDCKDSLIACDCEIIVILCYINMLLHYITCVA